MSGEARGPGNYSLNRNAVPGPRGFSRLRLLWRFLTSENRPSETLEPSFLLNLKNEYGSIVHLKNPIGTDTYFLIEPAYVRHVLETNQGNYRKSESQIADLTKVFGEGLVTTEGEFWRRHKRILAPMFTERRTEPFAGVVFEETDTMLQRWSRTNDDVNVFEESFDLVFDILGKVLIGSDFDGRKSEIRKALDINADEFPREAAPMPTAPEWIPTPHNRRLKQVRSILDDTIDELITERHHSTEKYDDLLEWLLRSSDERMDDEEIRDELKTILIAGLVTSSALSWSLYSLARHSDVQKNLRARLPENVSDQQSLSKLVDEVTYTRKIIQETLRIYPPLPPAVRSPIEDDTIGGYEIQSGANVIINQGPIHRDPEIWEDPLAFRPERFDPGWRDSKPRYSYYPFGGGSRTCIGRKFAYMILQIVLTMIASNYRLDAIGPSTRIEDDPTDFHSLHVSAGKRDDA